MLSKDLEKWNYKKMERGEAPVEKRQVLIGVALGSPWKTKTRRVSIGFARGHPMKKT